MKMMSHENNNNITVSLAEQGRDGPSLQGCKGWLLSDGVAGHMTLTRGVSDVLGLDAEVKPVAPRFPWKQLAPKGPADPQILKELLGAELPDIVLAAGRQTVPFTSALKKAGIFTVLFQSPLASVKKAHVIWVPAHDKLRGPNVITTLTPPHRFTPQRLGELRSDMPEDIAALPRPRIALLVGGPGAGFSFSDKTIRDFVSAVTALASQAGSFLITPSRRTPPDLLSAIDIATQSSPRIMWAGQDQNPYPYFLSCADGFIVTADSVNMTGEACATGRPVYVFMPEGGRPKFHHYHAALQDHGASRALTAGAQCFDSWRYEPLYSAAEIALEIEKRWCAYRSTGGEWRR